MTKRSRLLCDFDEPFVLCKETSQNAGLQKSKTRTLDREMQELEPNRRVEQGNVGINTVDAPRLDWQSFKGKERRREKGLRGRRGKEARTRSTTKATGTIRISDSKIEEYVNALIFMSTPRTPCLVRDLFIYCRRSGSSQLIPRD